jgi:N-acyl-phosphatidylethanolamine-hydrolysing phospholipase D
MKAIFLLLLLLLLPVPGWAQAPRDGDRFMNLAGHGDRGGFFNVRLPFFMRMITRQLRTPTGAAPLVPFDREALQHNPGITWIGHATFLVRLDGVTFLTDPIFSDRASPFSFGGPRRFVPPGVPLDELPPLDFVIISHDHYDHTDEPTIRALAARGTRFVVPLRLGEVVREAGGEAIELDWGGTIEVAGVKIHCVPAQHFSGRWLDDRDRRLWAGFVVEGPTTRFFHAGDTGYFDGFREIGERFGPIDVAAIPIGAYEPLAMMRFVHLTPEDAVQVAFDVRAQRVVPMHYGTFELTDEPFDEPPRRFRREAERRGLAEDRAWVLKIGETRTWGDDGVRLAGVSDGS